VWGYDPIQGAFAPPLRFRFHVVAVLALWSLVLYFWPAALVPDQCLPSMGGVSLSVLQSGIFSLTTYSFLQYVVHYLMPAVSHPGGAREHKIQRTPKWEDKSTTLESFAKNWRCVVAEESHICTEKKFEGTCAKITGEPSGRQMWTNLPSEKADNNSTTIDEKLVKEMAAGGRDNPGTFNPASNPNRYDFLSTGGFWFENFSAATLTLCYGYSPAAINFFGRLRSGLT
jgi:hypothetical protein